MKDKSGSIMSCSSGPTEPGIWGHAYEVNEGGPRLRLQWIPFRGLGARTRRTALAKMRNPPIWDDGGDPVGAPDDDDLEDRDEIVKTRRTREPSISDLFPKLRQKSTN
ncbi:Uncharacterized protein DBV15_09262 [Temnothorax longispinosus]|uniref:Uncharacterized protein n=1 Tax=Temnothorax longispinosus TaxID=300112 RepID=A0A4S2KW01_9HYME|nr:Uncharacterized protein DBV15_09262 [Temnothorax longispinosus]